MADPDIPTEQTTPDADADDAEHPHSEPEPLEVEVVEDPRDAQIAHLKDKLARAVADYDNLQKRTTRDAALERERVKGRVLEPFLQVFEYGRMAVAEAEKSPGPLAEGIKMVVREFERLLEGEGVKAFGAVGDAFDATRHEALAEEPAEGVAPGAVSRVIQPGYLLGEKILRYAKVAVAPADSAS